ncbi:MAG: hypothetical protein GEV11_24070 [Streptosporangiales bacterium]|nr:hypothetical protein [Streptosporangiales bacterium]
MAKPVVATIPRTERFDLRDESSRFLVKRKLADVKADGRYRSYVHQSFGFDHLNERVYFAGRKYGSDESSGDLVVTQMDFDGKIHGSMILDGLGHGSQIGVQPRGAGKAPYLWTEADPEVNDEGVAWGRRIGRFVFDDGGSVSTGDVEDHTPRIDGIHNVRPAIDPIFQRVLIKYNVRGEDGPFAQVWPLSAAGKRLDPRAAATGRIKLPSPNTQCQPSQGFALYGSFIYLMYGRPYGHNKGDHDDGRCEFPSRRTKGNTRILCVDANTGETVDTFRTRALRHLIYREPEGMAIWPAPNGSTPQPRLCFGFASGLANRRLASIVYKDALA